ncbi:CYTH domain-containing protein [Mammaliicoccus sp. Dog046]|uniref:CYTH domain-containing protein n=1 Tax=Mammaliicoccus sp. Dog046 TaxID=3034233 RepID=UPI002B263064|nr:CYTH domain-containing protein [Mammaliicoccus sp. Dog046]WQK84828.1 CYTH domain-containing protein [Mammaliicoccus sp. Dog046]
MAEELEIEFKNILTPLQYKKIKQTYFNDNQPFKQTNYYIDTPNHDIISKKMALRIRKKAEHYEMTLKVPQTVGLLEYNEVVDELPSEDRFLHRNELPPQIVQVLSEHHIEIENLRLLGELTTYRLEKQLDSGLLVLDHSLYLGIEDYELEFEVTDYEQGEIAFEQLLTDLQIDKQTPDNKVKRFFDANRRTT